MGFGIAVLAARPASLTADGIKSWLGYDGRPSNALA